MTGDESYTEEKFSRNNNHNQITIVDCTTYTISSSFLYGIIAVITTVVLFGESHRERFI